ncbi:MAG: acetyl-CoA carboxylase biotin carboxyl carrier protein [Campylobacter sp.]|nr:acetyl-CoA carboxylase biotin carboxyl carrier protein [Campylobacter sp.]
MKKEDIKELMEYFDTIGIAKMKIKEGDFQIELVKNKEEIVTCTPTPAEFPKPQIPQTQTVEIVTRTEQATNGETIKSPMVGTFYKAPAPGASPYVKAGDTVKKGDIVGIVEAMKIMNEIEAEFDCKILKILVDDGQPVEYGLDLFEVEKI